MMAGERLHQLAGISGTAAALLLAIGAGATTGAALVDYSGLATGTAAQHLLAERVTPSAPPAGGGYGTIADQLWREAVKAARRQVKEAETGLVETQEAELPTYAPGYWPEPSQAKINEMFQAKLGALKAAKPIIAARVAEYLAKEEEEAIIALMLWMDD